MNLGRNLSKIQVIFAMLKITMLLTTFFVLQVHLFVPARRQNFYKIQRAPHSRLTELRCTGRPSSTAVHSGSAGCDDHEPAWDWQLSQLQLFFLSALLTLYRMRPIIPNSHLDLLVVGLQGDPNFLMRLWNFSPQDPLLGSLYPAQPASRESLLSLLKLNLKHHAYCLTMSVKVLSKANKH